MLYSRKWWVQTRRKWRRTCGGSMWNTVALMEWSNLFQTLVSALPEPACKHKCSLPKRNASVNSCSPESTHKICCSFIREIKDYTVNTCCSALFFLRKLKNLISLHYITNLSDELAMLNNRLYCDLDRRLYDCLFESWRQYEKASRLLMGTEFVLS